MYNLAIQPFPSARHFFRGCPSGFARPPRQAASWVHVFGGGDGRFRRIDVVCATDGHKVASDFDQTYEAKIAAGDAALTAERVQWPDRVPATAQGLEDYERKQRDRKLKHWQSTADALGFQLVEIQKVAITVS
jgi:hypothetical protein